MTAHAGPMRSQRLTANDIAVGQIRFPASAKLVFPLVTSEVQLVLRGHKTTAHWNPRIGPDRERSGVLRIGRNRLADHVRSDEVLIVSSDRNGAIVLT